MYHDHGVVIAAGKPLCDLFRENGVTPRHGQHIDGKAQPLRRFPQSFTAHAVVEHKKTLARFKKIDEACLHPHGSGPVKNRAHAVRHIEDVPQLPLKPVEDFIETGVERPHRWEGKRTIHTVGHTGRAVPHQQQCLDIP